ncbi:MAG: trigger factor [Saprospiraceae bacterium]
MSKVVREDIDNLNAVVTVTLEKSDYEAQFDQELQKFRKQAAMKGFRKGKTPANMVRKMYGRSVLADLINNLLSKELFGYISEEKLEVLGQPLPSKDQPYIDFDTKELNDFIFKFDLGLSPQFEVQGLNADAKFDRYTVEMNDEAVTEELTNYRKRLGERKNVEGNIQEGDFVKFAAKAVEGDFTTEFGIFVNEIENQAFKDELFTKTIGDSIRTDVYQWFNEPDDHYIRHHLLNIDHEDHDTKVGELELTITEATRQEIAEMDEDFFAKAFGSGVASNEEEAREVIRKDATKFFDKQADALLFRDFQEYLMEQNKLDLPDEFLLRWLKTSNEKVAPELIERDYPAFSKNLQWTLIRNKLGKQFDIQISEEAIVEGFKEKVRSYFGGYGNEELINATAQRLLDDEKQFNEMYEDLLVDRLHDEIVKLVTVNPKPVSREDFTKVLQEARAAAQAAQMQNITIDADFVDEAHDHDHDHDHHHHHDHDHEH